MKQISRLLSFAAAAAMCFSACSPEELKNGEVNVSKFVTVHFGTENTDPASTKATLTPNEGETAFQAAWENGDELSVYYINDKVVENDFQNGIVPATWNGNSFSAELPEYTGEWEYRAAYPIPDAKDNHVDFGPNRTQKGNAYNSKYDIMIGSAVAKNAAAGKDDYDNDIVFQMDRQTAIAYFHFTSDLDEAVNSATLTVSGEGAAIASNYAYVSNFAWAPAEDCQSITITFPEQAPNAQDFQLWFNVLKTKYSSMSLTVETATKTFTISKNTAGEYVAGKLYKVKKGGIAWTDKPTTIYFYESFNQTTGTGGNDGKWSGSIASNNVTYDNEGWSVKKEGGANQCLKLGSTDTKGSATTPALGIRSQSASLYFKAGAWNSTSENRTINLSVSGPGSISPTSVSLDKGEWSEYECSITGADETTKIVFEAVNTSNNRFFIDEVYVYSGPKPAGITLYTVSMATVEGGALSATPAEASAGAEITLTATPAAGYEFNNDWTVKDADGAKIDVYDGKFTMPAKDVTVSGSFSKVDYTITKVDCEGGSFTVKKNGVEVTKAQIGESITLTASAADGYEFDSWTVTNESTSKTVYVSENSFTMPGANVTVSANFLKADEVPVYASVAELIADRTPTSDGEYVTVTLSNEEITKFFTTSTGDRRGVYFTVGMQEIELFGDIACPEEWVAGGWVSGTLTKCKWMLYKSTWELCPADWTELTYAAPCEKPDITLDGAVATITCATEGATIRYTLDETDPTETSDIYKNSISLNEGQTIKAKAFLEGHKASAVASATYSSSVEPVTYENSGTLASWDFTSSSYPTNKTDYANNGSDDLASGTFYLNGTGSTWHATKGYAFTAVTDITITVKATKALKQGAKITFSMDTYYNKASNAPMTGFDLTAAEGDATASKTGLSATSFSLSTSSATKSVDYTLQNDVSAGSTVKLILTQTGKAGAGQGYIDNIKAKYTAE